MTFLDLAQTLVQLANTAVFPLLQAFAFLGFLIGVVRYFFMGGEEGRSQGRQFMLWSVVGFAVLFSTWGLVNLLLATLPQ